MESWLEFGRGALFRLSAVILVLGLLRIFILSLYGIRQAYVNTEDKVLPWGDLTKSTFRWLIPVTKLWTKRPVYSTISFVWHIGLILIPLFLFAHVNLLFHGSLKLSWWPSLPQNFADMLSIITVVMGIAIFFGRAGNRNARFISRFQDYLWPILITIIFATGVVCATLDLSAKAYLAFMVIHVYAANLSMILIPNTKAAHCVLLPLSQYVAGIGWKFPKGAGQRVAKTLGKEGMPV